MRCWSCGNDNPDSYERCWSCRAKANHSNEKHGQTEFAHATPDIDKSAFGGSDSTGVAGLVRRALDAAGDGVTVTKQVSQRIVIKGRDGRTREYASLAEMPAEERERIEKEMRAMGISLPVADDLAKSAEAGGEVPEYVRRFLNRDALGTERGLTFRIHGTRGGLVGAGISVAAGLAFGGFAAWKMLSNR